MNALAAPNLYDLYAPTRAASTFRLPGGGGNGSVSFASMLDSALRGESGAKKTGPESGAAEITAVPDAAPWVAAAYAEAARAADRAVASAGEKKANGEEPEDGEDAAAQSAFEPERREKLLAAMSEAERADFALSSPARQEAYLRWKDQSLRVRQSAEDFAGFFYGFMLKEMRGTVEQGELGHGGKGEQVFQELVDEETGKGLASGDRTGLVDTLHRSLSGVKPYLGVEPARTASTDTRA